MDIQDKFRLSDIEPRFHYYDPVRRDSELPHTSEGLILPTEQLFSGLVTLYRVYLVVWSMVIALITAVFLISSVLLIRDERSKERDIASLAIPILGLVALLLIVHNCVSWMGIMTFKMRYIWADIWLHCLEFATAIVSLMFFRSLGNGIAIGIKGALIALLYGLINEFRSANPLLM